MSSRNHNDNSIVRQLTICGGILILGYIGLFCLMQAPAFWYSLRPDPVRSLIPEIFGPINALFPQKWVTLDRMDRFALIAVPIYLSVVALITGPLLYLLRAMSRSGSPIHPHRKTLLRRIFGFTLGIMLILLFQRGLLSTDIYNYEWYSRIWVEYGQSPYTHVPSEFPPDPEGSIHWIGWPNVPAVYGPAWLIASSVVRVIGQLMGSTFSAQLLALRLLADGAHLLNAWLVWNIAGRILSRPEPKQPREARLRWRFRRQGPSLPRHTGHYPLRHVVNKTAVDHTSKVLGLQFGALLFYIWNPLLLVEFAGSGHNDVLMLTFVLLSVWLHIKGWWRMAALALGVATLIKISAILLVPGYLWLLLWEGSMGTQKQYRLQHLARGVGKGAQALAIMLAAWIVFYLPFWEGLRTLQAIGSGPGSRFFLQTLAADVYWNVPKLLANSIAASDERNLFIASMRRILLADMRLWLMGLFGVIALALTWRARTLSRMLTAWGWITIVAVMTQGWFWPWYVTWAVVPAALTQPRRLRNATLVFTVSALLLYIEALILSDHFKLFEEWPGTLVMAPPLVYILFSWLGDAWRKRKRHNLAQLAVPTSAPYAPPVAPV